MRLKKNLRLSKSYLVLSLTIYQSHTHVPEVVLKEKINVSNENLLFSEQDSNWTGETNLSDELMTEEGWLNKLRTMQNLDSTEAKKHMSHWAAYHALQSFTNEEGFECSFTFIL